MANRFCRGRVRWIHHILFLPPSVLRLWNSSSDENVASDNETAIGSTQGCKVESIVFRLVNFMVYLEKHVQDAKSFMHQCIHEKRDFLVQPPPTKSLADGSPFQKSALSPIKSPTSTRRNARTPTKSPARVRTRGNIASNCTPPRSVY